MSQTTAARTFSEWWSRRYAREHLVVGVLVGCLVAVVADLPLGVLLSGLG